MTRSHSGASHSGVAGGTRSRPARKAAHTADPSPALAAAIPGEADSAVTHGAPFIDSERRDAMIRKAAYYRAESRGFCPGKEVDDWLEAEADVDRLLAASDAPTACGG